MRLLFATVLGIGAVLAPASAAADTDTPPAPPAAQPIAQPAAQPATPPAEQPAAQPAAQPPPTPTAPLPPEDRSAAGFSFGLRAGYSVPLGLAKSVLLSDVVAGAIPIGVELGYFLNPHLYVGGYFVYGFGFVAGGATSTCPNDSDVTCTANLFRFGAGAQWHFRPREELDPWAGVGLGYDVVNLTGKDSTGATVLSSSLHGFELLNVQAGVDFKPAKSYGLGPFVELSLGHYASDGSSTTTHGWLTFGLRLHSIL